MLVSGGIYIAENISNDTFKIHFLVTKACFGLVFGERCDIVADFFIAHIGLLNLVLVKYDDN